MIVPVTWALTTWLSATGWSLENSTFALVGRVPVRAVVLRVPVVAVELL
jgi:hypothetical protein